jgi:branched-chain amino acid transport system ATP-binding protein
MSAGLLQARGLTKQFGALRVTNDVTLDVREGEIHGLIGPNGAGKTTLIGQLTGLLAPDAGTISFNGEDLTALTMSARVAKGLCRSFQIASVFSNLSAEQNVALPLQIRSGHSFRFWRAAADERSLIDPARALLDKVGLRGRGHIPCAELAYGEKRQLEIAMALACQPRMLILDEPLAGLGPEESKEMVALLRSLKGSCAMLLVEHDIEAVFSLADRISVLVQGEIIMTGDAEAVRQSEDVQLAYLGSEA